jgi:trimeric autotransporter adhesin
VAGTGIPGFSGDGGPATQAQLILPLGMVVDAHGNLFIADDDSFRIREVNLSTGIITTVAGNGTQGFSGDGGPATQAQLSFPGTVAVDAQGNLFIPDELNNRIREVNLSTGIITTFAGTGTAGFSGDGGPATAAQFHEPVSVALDAQGNLFIADFQTSVIREIDHATGIITTMAGNGTQGFSGDNGPGTAAELDAPDEVTLDALGDLFIDDFGNSRIREVTSVNFTASTPGRHLCDRLQLSVPCHR